MNIFLTKIVPPIFGHQKSGSRAGQDPVSPTTSVIIFFLPFLSSSTILQSSSSSSSSEVSTSSSYSRQKFVCTCLRIKFIIRIQWGFCGRPPKILPTPFVSSLVRRVMTGPCTLYAMTALLCVQTSSLFLFTQYEDLRESGTSELLSLIRVPVITNQNTVLFPNNNQTSKTVHEKVISVI